MTQIHEFCIGSIKWKITADNDKLEELGFLGLCEFAKSTISFYEKGIDEELVEQTIYHEVVHAILESMGELSLSRNDKFVQTFSLLLHQFEKTKK